MMAVPEMPESFKNKIEEMDRGSNVVLVIQKELKLSDASCTHGRLSLPLQQIQNNFLKPKEEERLVHGFQPVKVKLIEPCVRKVPDVILRYWNLFNMFLLDWPKEQVVMNAENALKPGTMIQLYAFRLQSNDQLCFALVDLDLVN